MPLVLVVVVALAAVPPVPACVRSLAPPLGHHPGLLAVLRRVALLGNDRCTVQRRADDYYTTAKLPNTFGPLGHQVQLSLCLPLYLSIVGSECNKRVHMTTALRLSFLSRQNK